MEPIRNIKHDARPDTVRYALIYDARGNGGGHTAPTITGDHQNRVTDYTAIVLEYEKDTDADI